MVINGYVSEGESPEIKSGALKRYNKKIVILGNGGVGKTTLLIRYVTGRFNARTSITIGSDFYVKKVFYDKKSGKIYYNDKEMPPDSDGFGVNLLLWDFAGEDRFRFLLKDYVKGAQFIIYTFDLSRPKTLYALEDWIDAMGKENVTGIPGILIGTKADLVGGHDFIDRKFIGEFISKHNMIGFLEVSSKTGKNVDELFRRITEKLLSIENV